MRMLAIDCSLGQVSFAASMGSKVYSYVLHDKNKSDLGSSLFDLLAEVVEGTSITDFEKILLSIGPGSFTDIRIVMALGRGLNLAMPENEFLGCTALEILALIFLNEINPQNSFPFFSTVYCPSTRKQYGQMFDKEGLATEVPRVYEEGDLLALKEQYKMLNIVGCIPKIFNHKLSEGCCLFPKKIDARALCRMADFIDPHTHKFSEMKPLYIRKTYVNTN